MDEGKSRIKFGYCLILNLLILGIPLTLGSTMEHSLQCIRAIPLELDTCFIDSNMVKSKN